MEKLILSESQLEKYIYEALVDCGYGYPGEMVFRTIIDKNNKFYFELDIYTYYEGIKTKTTHTFAIKDYVELLKHSLHKNGYDTDKVYVYVRHGKLKVSIQTDVATHDFVPKKRRKR